MSNLIGLADANNFFYSCECTRNPHLIAKPVVILSSNDGCVVARSNEAKALGVMMGEAVFKRRSWFQRQGIIMLSGDLFFYSMLSARMFEILEQAVPSIELYSIDEAFFTPALSWNESHACGAERIICYVLQNLGILLTIGIAPTKTLAKIAAGHAKRQRQYQHVLETPEQIADILKATAVEDVWGIGRRRAACYRYHNIQTAAKLIKTPPETVRRYSGLNGLRTYYELRGRPCYNEAPRDEPIKSCLVSQSFGRSVETLDGLQEAIAHFTNKLARKLRRAHVLAIRIAVFINTNRFQNNYFAPHGEIVIEPSNDTALLNAATSRVLKDIFRPHHRYRRAGVACAQVVPIQASSASLFDDRETMHRRKRLWEAVDGLNDRFGKSMLHCGHYGNQERWLPQRQHTTASRQQSHMMLDV